MVKVCCYGLCKSSDGPDGFEDGVTFIRFPQPRYNLSKCRKWAQLCGRSDFSHKNVTNFTWICSKHFPTGVDLDFRKNKDLEPFQPRQQVSRSSPKPPKTYGRGERKLVSVPVANTPTVKDAAPSSIDVFSFEGMQWVPSIFHLFNFDSIN